MWINEPFRVKVDAKLNDLMHLLRNSTRQAEKWRTPNMDRRSNLLDDAWWRYLRISVSLGQFACAQCASYFSISIFTETRAILNFKMANFPMVDFLNLALARLLKGHSLLVGIFWEKTWFFQVFFMGLFYPLLHIGCQTRDRSACNFVI